MKALLILTILAALFTFGTLIIGVTGMARSKDFNKKYGNRLMQMRVAGQAVTVLLILLMAASS